MNRIDLNDRVAIITGGAQGIGYAAAQRMLRSGASVALWDIDAKRLHEAETALNALIESHSATLAPERSMRCAAA